MSDIRANTISDAAGTGPITLTGQSAAKAWVNFNGTGTVAIRDSLNVSSLTDNGTGQYIVNFSNNFNNTTYTHVGMGGQDNNSVIDITQPFNFSPPATGSSRYDAAFANTSAFDPVFVGVSNLGDLA